MSDGQPFPHERGVQIVRDLLVDMAQTFTRAAPAGSLRGGKAQIGDVELLLAPAFEGTRNLLDERLHYLLGSKLERRVKNGRIVGWGPRWKAAVYQGIAVDLFLVLPDRQWGPALVMRTGPYEANRVLVTSVGVRNELGDMGVLPKGIKWKDLTLRRGDVGLSTPEEEHVFAACALPWMPPSFRTVEKYQQWSEPDWEGAYRISQVYSQWPERNPAGYRIPVDAIDLNGTPLWLDEQFAGAVPSAVYVPPAGVDVQQALFET